MRKKKFRVLRLVLWITVFLLSVAAAAAATVFGVYAEARFEKEFPREYLSSVGAAKSPEFFVRHFTDRAARQGTLENVTDDVFAQQKTEYTPYGEIPPRLIDAFVAIEDKRFYSHHGVDWYRTAAAVLGYLKNGKESFGASTVTQQLVKNLTGDNEVTPERKLREIIYARDLERKLDKTEILEAYLNVIPFSENCIGVAGAARHYYSKSLSELTVAECASIAAITNSPAYYNPIRHPENNLARRNLILSEMFSQGYLDEETYRAALSEPLLLSPQPVAEGINSWYTDMVIEDVITDLMSTRGMTRAAASRNFYTGGLRIEMAMDPAVQKIAEDYYRTSVATPTDASGNRAQSALIILDSRTGDILGVAGAVGEKRGNLVQNFATQTLRPPGSTIKPLTVYAPALEKGLITWGSVYDDVPVDFSGGTAWPKNADGIYRGKTNIACAVAHSTNTVAVRVLQELGLDKAYSAARDKFGLSHIDPADKGIAALALGQLTHGVTLREMTAAYTAFADAGVRHDARSYFRVTDADGNLILSRPDGGDPVLSASNAAVITKLLQGVVSRGTSSSVTLRHVCECAGKTGTTSNDGDRWFIGYTPDYVCGVWCGYEYPAPLTGRNLCTTIWNDVMSSVQRAGRGRTVFDVPSDVIRAAYCRDSGDLLSDACTFDPRGSRKEYGWFVYGTEPRSACTTHVLCRYDHAGGGVDHGFCPAEDTDLVALIRADRHFPQSVTVADAPYVYHGEPTLLVPNEDPSAPYFASDSSDPVGIAPGTAPFNRSCPLHRKREDFFPDFPLPGDEGVLPRPWDPPAGKNLSPAFVPPA